jgi:hypothetical protein
MTAPAFSNLDATIVFTENGAAVALDTDARIKQ